MSTATKTENANDMNSFLILGTTSIFIVGAFVYYFMNKAKDEDFDESDEEPKAEKKEVDAPKKKKKNKKIAEKSQDSLPLKTVEEQLKEDKPKKTEKKTEKKTQKVEMQEEEIIPENKEKVEDENKQKKKKKNKNKKKKDVVEQDTVKDTKNEVQEEEGEWEEVVKHKPKNNEYSAQQKRIQEMQQHYFNQF